jgi:hypothetical protein
MMCFLEYVIVSILRENTMKNILLGIIAINLTFISANLAVAADPSGSDVADIGDLTTGKISAVISDGAEESGEDANLNDLNSKTDVVITGGEDLQNQIKKVEEDPE